MRTRGTAGLFSPQNISCLTSDIYLHVCMKSRHFHLQFIVKSTIWYPAILVKKSVRDHTIIVFTFCFLTWSRKKPGSSLSLGIIILGFPHHPPDLCWGKKTHKTSRVFGHHILLSRRSFPDDEGSIFVTWRSPNAHSLWGYYSKWSRIFHVELHITLKIALPSFAIFSFY